MIKPRLKFTALLVLGLLTGCTGKYIGPASQQVGSPHIAIVADSEVIYVGGSTTFTITSKNLTGAVVDFGRGSSSCWFEVQIVNEGSGKNVPFSRNCTRDYTHRYLEPGEEHSEVVTWRARMRVENEFVNVQPGVYQVKAVANGMESSPITVNVQN